MTDLKNYVLGTFTCLNTSQEWQTSPTIHFQPRTEDNYHPEQNLTREMERAYIYAFYCHLILFTSAYTHDRNVYKVQTDSTITFWSTTWWTSSVADNFVGLAWGHSDHSVFMTKQTTFLEIKTVHCIHKKVIGFMQYGEQHRSGYGKEMKGILTWLMHADPQIWNTRVSNLRHAIDESRM